MIKDVYKRFKTPIVKAIDDPTKFPGQITDLDKKSPRRTKVIETIIRRRRIQKLKDNRDWRIAVDDARRIEEPSRRQLMEIYEHVDDDGHITGIVQSIKNKIKAKDFIIVNTDGKENEEATALLEKKWFFKFLDLIIESKFWGYSLAQLGDIIDYGFPDLEGVPREHIVPELNIVRKDLHGKSSRGIEVFKYRSDQLKDWFIFIGDNDLGLYNKASPHALAKRILFAAAWEYADLFGIPIRIGRTDIRDPERKKNMELMLENMGSSLSVVLHDEDKVEFIESDKSDILDVFIEPIKISNQEISKAFAGQVGVFDEKAFVGSAEVQERLFMEFIASFMRLVKFVINDDLIPRMVIHGILPEGLTFKFVREETLTSIEKAGIIKELAPFFTFDPDVVSEEIGIPVSAGAIAPETPGGSVTSVMPDVARLYKPFINKE